MISFILSLLLNKVSAIGIPLILCAVALFLALRGLIHIAIVIAMVAGGVFAAGTLYQEGVKACEAHTAREIAKVETRLAASRAEAEAFQDKLVAGLLAKNGDLERQKTELEHAADADPAAADCGIGPDSVQRLNSIGRAPRKH